MIDITLAKLKYRRVNRRLLRRDQVDPPGGTWVWMAGKFKSPANNSGDKQRARQGTGHRRRQGLGAVGR